MTLIKCRHVGLDFLGLIRSNNTLELAINVFSRGKLEILPELHHDNEPIYYFLNNGASRPSGCATAIKCYER